MGWAFTNDSNGTKIAHTNGTIIRTNQQVSISPGSDGTSVTIIMGSHTQGFQVAEIDTIAGAPAASSIGAIIEQLIPVFPDALAQAAAGAVKSVNGETPDAGGNVTVTSADVGAIPATEKGQASGVTPLGPDSKVDPTYLNISGGFTYKGSWNAATNTPALADGVGTNGDLYKVSVAGSRDLGSGIIVFNVGDHVAYVSGENKWENFGASEAVASVNGKTGAVVLSAADVGAIAPINQGSIVYGTNLEGQQSPVAYGNAPAAFTLVMGDFNGNFTVNNPTADEQPATKKYVDDAIAAINPTTDAAKLFTASASGDGSKTVFNVPHGLTNPTMVMVWPNSENAKDVAFAEINGANVDIVYDNAPILDASPNLYWTILIK